MCVCVLSCVNAVGGREYSDVDAARLQIRHPTTLKAIFSSVVGVLEEAQQVSPGCSWGCHCRLTANADRFGRWTRLSTSCAATARV